MNKHKLLLLFTFISFSSFSQYTIPGASQQPAWVFPIWFEDGAGQKDTVYIGYDNKAKSGFNNSDTIFGEKWVKIDTNKFNVTWGGNIVDSAYKILVGPLAGSGVLTGLIQFLNGKWPLKIKFDISLFYSDSLPFYQDSLNYPDTIPRGYVVIWCSDFDPNFNNCSNDVPWRLTNDPLNYFWEYEATDSIVFYGNNAVSSPDGWPLDLQIKPYAMFVGISEIQILKNNFKLFPNPFHDILHIVSLQKKSYTYNIYDVLGKEVLTNEWIYENNKELDMSYLARGVYIIKIYTSNQSFISKIIKYQ